VRVGYYAMFVDVRPRKSSEFMCQNCVTYPPKPGVNTSIYEDTRMNIVVVRSRLVGVRWWDFVCVSTRGGSQFPSVLLQPLGDLSYIADTRTIFHAAGHRRQKIASKSGAMLRGQALLQRVIGATGFEPAVPKPMLDDRADFDRGKFAETAGEVQKALRPIRVTASKKQFETPVLLDLLKRLFF